MHNVEKSRGRDGRNTQHTWGYEKHLQNLESIWPLRDLGIDGMVLLKWILKKYTSVHWIYMAQDGMQSWK